jgi:HD-GYP domain-containing protein (c-di-GMP phosphodiesterase class II)
MAVKQEKVSTSDLAIGMYIAALDRPWVETPFPIQGFHIKEQTDIEQIRRFCKHVYVDQTLSRAKATFKPASVAASAVGRKAAMTVNPAARIRKFTPIVYQNTQPLQKEVAVATTLHQEIARAVVQVLNDVRGGKELNIPVVRKVAGLMVNSVTRNPDAFVWLSRVRDADSYSYAHSLRSSVWALVLGRHLGMPRDILEELALGVLLSEVGKTKIPRSLLMKPGKLTAEETAQVRQHVEYGVDILRQCPGVSETAISVVQFHHERHDGSGYPYCLAGADIPLLARIAGIVDSYDAITSPRPYAEARSSSEAVSMLYESRDQLFQAQLIEQFIQAVGVYPTGTMVQLSTQEVGVVISQNTSRRLRPVVMLVADHEQMLLARSEVVDLMEMQHDSVGRPLSISRCLAPGEFGIDPKMLQVSAAS